MTNLNTEKLPANVVEEAIHIIQTQGPTPYTPGERRSDGGIALCAAAALAYAGLTLAGFSERLRQFEEELVASKSVDSIRKVFKELGWSEALCNTTMSKNDGFTPSARRRGVMLYLQNLSTS
jgi:hypothetical protein